MTQVGSKSKFKAKLLRPAKLGSDESWSFLILPKAASDKLPRRGRTTVEVSLNSYGFKATLEPDGQLSHWLSVSDEQREAAGADIGDLVAVEIAPVQHEPEPEVPSDLAVALAANAEARREWNSTTTIARLDWIHWITTAKQAKSPHEADQRRLRYACVRERTRLLFRSIWLLQQSLQRAPRGGLGIDHQKLTKRPVQLRRARHIR